MRRGAAGRRATGRWARAEHFPVIVGAGQAGMSVSWQLQRRGIEHVILERDTIAHEWRDSRWNNLTLVMPNWQCELPGYPYGGDDPHGFMTRDDVCTFVRNYAAAFNAPVREHVSVTDMTNGPAWGYDVQTSAGKLHAGARSHCREHRVGDRFQHRLPLGKGRGLRR